VTKGKRWAIVPQASDDPKVAAVKAAALAMVNKPESDKVTKQTKSIAKLSSISKPKQNRDKTEKRLAAMKAELNAQKSAAATLAAMKDSPVVVKPTENDEKEKNIKALERKKARVNRRQRLHPYQQSNTEKGKAATLDAMWLKQQDRIKQQDRVATLEQDGLEVTGVRTTKDRSIHP